MHLLALTQRLCQAFLPVALGFLTPLDSHVQGAKVVLKFQVDCSLSCGEGNLLDGLAARNLIDLGNVLTERSEGRSREVRLEYTPDGRICPRRLVPMHDDGRAIQGCGPRGRSETSPRLVISQYPSLRQRG